MSKKPIGGILSDNILQTVSTFELLPMQTPLSMQTPVLLMVSGGSDSVSMAHLLPKLYPQNKFYVLHVNHQLRGQDASADEQFVAELCQQLDLPYKIERVDVAAIAAQQGDNLEQAGRKLRYSLANAELDDICDDLGVDPASGRIATAHTIDDRAETLLMRIIVGGGSASLSSIPYRNQRVIRPLLDCRREDLQTWLLEQGVGFGTLSSSQPWREDASNADTTYSRAFVRHKIMPLLQERNPKILETLAKNANVLAAESAYLDQQARALLPLQTASFQAPLALLRRAIYMAYSEAAQDLAPDARIDFEHIDLIAKQGARFGFACHLPGGIELRNVKGHLSFKVAKPPRHTPG
jgi:tRNA(Ile)-lysidine synthase